MIFNCLYSWNELGTREVKGVVAPIAIGLLPSPMQGLPVPLPVLPGSNCIVFNSELFLWCLNFKNVILSTYRDGKKGGFYMVGVARKFCLALPGCCLAKHANLFSLHCRPPDINAWMSCMNDTLLPDLRQLLEGAERRRPCCGADWVGLCGQKP